MANRGHLLDFTEMAQEEVEGPPSRFIERASVVGTPRTKIGEVVKESSEQ